MKVPKKTNSPYHKVGTTLAVTILLVCTAISTAALSQEALRNGTVAPMGQWLEYREARFSGSPILVHLRTGYERAIVLPEPVALRNPNQNLPGCEIIINDNIVAFYPTRTYARQSVEFIGLETGNIYDLRIRASTKGMRQPMRVNRQ